jgi:hypothetical protein
MHVNRSNLITAVILLCAAVPASAGRFLLEYGDKQEVVTPFEIDEGLNLSTFYGNGGTVFVGTDDAVTNAQLQTGFSHLFLVDNGSETGVVVVHNKNDSTQASRQLAYADMTMVFDGPAGSYLAHEDESSESSISYDTENTIVGNWTWQPRYTDGLVAGWQPGPEDSVTISFQETTNVQGWTFFSPDFEPTVSADDPGRLSLASGELTEQSITLTMLPLPPTAWPAVGILGLVVVRKWRARRLTESETRQ